MGNSDFKNLLLSFYGVKDTDFSDSTPLTGEERIAIVQNNLNVLATVNDLISLIPCGFLNAPKNINTLDKAMDWFSNLKASQGKKIGAVVSYFDTDSGVAEVMRFVGGNTLPETIKDSTNWEWFNSGSATFKGLFNNEQELKLSAPSPKIGDHAFVGDTLENSTLYVCSKNGTWRKSKRLFNDIVSKFDAVFSVENGEQLEMYDEFIADKALMDAEGNEIHNTYLRIADRDIFINGINEKIDKIRKEKFEPLKKDIKNSFQLNPDDLTWDMDDRLSFAERPNNTKSKYGFVYLRNEKPLTDDSFSRTGDKIIYAIRFNHDLGGRTINIPDNTVLDFTYGGSFTNGTLNLGKNVIIRTFDRDQIDVKINGSYKLMESFTNANGETIVPTPPPTPKPVEPTVVNANVYSSTNDIYTALDTNNLENSNYSGNIYQGDVMSDGTFRVKKSLVHTTTNEVVYGDQPSYTEHTQFGAKNATFKYAYNQVTHYWKDGQNTVFSYSTITGRNTGADYVEPVAPVTVVRANVYSFSKTSFDEATSAKASERDYKNNLYLGNLMSDGTFQYIKDVVPTVGNANLFGRTENETDVRNLVTTKSAEYKYSYLTRQARWVDGANIIEYHKILQRKPEYDYVAPITVVRPNVLSFSKTSFDEATSAKALARDYIDENLYLGNVMSDGTFQYIEDVSAEELSDIEKYGKTENETDITKLNSNKGPEYRYAYITRNAKWQKGSNIVEYHKIVRRIQSSDYVVPVTVVTASALSFAKNTYQAATTEELVRRRHEAMLYVGNVMSDGTFQFVKELPANVTKSVKYGSAENVTDVNQLNATGDATNKYAYNVKTVTWETTPATTISFVEARRPANDFSTAPTIVNDYALSFNRNSYEEVTLDKIKAKGARINHQWVGNSIYIGKLKSDGSYEPTMALPYRNEYLVKYGATENETNVDNLTEYGSAEKPYAYNVINHIWAGQKPNGDRINYSYMSVSGRKSDSDYSPRKFIKTKNVFSYRQTIYDSVTSDNLKTKNHTGILWFGDEMSDGSMKSGAIQVQEQTSAEVIYGNRENLSDNPNFGEKSEVFKYAFNATKYRWFTTAMNPDTNLNQLYSVEYYSNISRDASKDYGKQPVTPPGRPTPPKNLGSIYISPEDVEGVTVSAGSSGRFNSYKARFLEDSGIREINLNTVDVTYSNVTNSFVEGEFAIYNDTYKPLKVYRMNPNRVLELVGELDYYNTDYNSYGRNLNLENKVVGSNKAMVVKDSRVPELENLIVFFGESHTRRIGIKDIAGVIGIYQKGQQLTSVGSNSNGTLYEFDDLLPVTFVLGKDDVSYTLVHNDNSNTRVASHTYTVDTTSSTRYDFIVFNKAETLPENGITISGNL
mgnify:FL=1